MDVKQVAEQLGVTPRRVRAMIAAGRIEARKVGRRWEIVEVPEVRSRRPLSARSRRLLAHALHERTLSGLEGQERARTAARIRLLRASPDPAGLLADWWGGTVESGLVDFGTNLVQHALHGDPAYVREALHRPRREYLRRPEDLADVVGSERRIQGLSTDELAHAAGVAASDVRRLERGLPMSTPSTARRVLDVLGVEPTALPDLDCR
ncbi:helix-turn-helix domain-containing protein [Rathayibacter sp. VKM Ac-2804]|uniref:helix-turn-helix domain-containing protein n=1 Tax=Rathayibacter sp. VKM Ac-2804 TaxID=2609257 RepID=UPI00132F0917|nr:helix-turn-helix domain-containing protein [Rathayibacter sp. VKM Ac-2804]QHF23229.1 helix-turn-helix domain-containing protein [Rathayibacter sp. VKM Ac-2804]